MRRILVGHEERQGICVKLGKTQKHNGVTGMKEGLRNRSSYNKALVIFSTVPMLVLLA